jgi:hypothetical protein
MSDELDKVEDTVCRGPDELAIEENNELAVEELDELAAEEEVVWGGSTIPPEPRTVEEDRASPVELV